MRPDYRFIPHGYDLWLILPTSDQAADHLRVRLPRPQQSWWGPAMAIEHKHAGTMATLLELDGYSVEVLSVRQRMESNTVEASCALAIHNV